MKWSILAALALFSFSAFSSSLNFHGTVDLSQNSRDFSYTSPYKGKVNVAIELVGAPLHLVSATAKKVYWGDPDVHEEDAYYCATSMSFSPITVNFVVTDERGNVLTKESRSDVPMGQHSFHIAQDGDCEVTLPETLSLDLKGLYHDYLKIGLAAYPDRVLDLMPVVLGINGRLEDGTVTNIESGNQGLQWFVYHKDGYRAGETVGNTVPFIKE